MDASDMDELRERVAREAGRDAAQRAAAAAHVAPGAAAAAAQQAQQQQQAAPRVLITELDA
jgi:hypothetical protein